MQEEKYLQIMQSDKSLRDRKILIKRKPCFVIC